MKSQDYGIDVLEIIKHLVNRVWIIVLCTVIAAVAVMPVMGLMPQKARCRHCWPYIHGPASSLPIFTFPARSARCWGTTRRFRIRRSL